MCDLGDDVMKVFKFCEEEGSMKQVSEFKTGPESLAKNGFHGPRYTVFSKCGKFGYIVNEISNSVCVLQIVEMALSQWVYFINRANLRGRLYLVF